MAESGELGYLDILRGLASRGVDFVAAGGVAMNMHGVPRMTYDLDLVVLLEDSNLARLVGVVTEWGYAPRAPVDAQHLVREEKRRECVRDKSVHEFTFVHHKQPVGEIDVLLDPSLDFEGLKRRAEVRRLEGFEVKIASRDDLAAMKRASGREHDKADILNLQKLGKP